MVVAEGARSLSRVTLLGLLDLFCHRVEADLLLCSSQGDPSSHEPERQKISVSPAGFNGRDGLRRGRMENSVRVILELM
jgi:hypothetical protein